MKFTNILGLSVLFAAAVNARTIDDLSSAAKSNEDQYYLCYVNNKHGEYRVFGNQKNQKRDAPQVFIEGLVDEINELILDNKDTYEDPEKLDEIAEEAQLRKRTDEYQTYDGSNFVYPISSVNDRVVLYAYLSKTLVERLPSKIADIIECSPDEAFAQFYHKNYNADEILAETKWKSLGVRENADLHLSLLSQGKYNKNSGKKYDDNYYFPASNGKDVDIVLLDSSFAFGYSEFSNLDDRKVECSGIVKNGKVSTNVSGGCDLSTVYHGESTSVTAAGLTHGVASRANVYGVVVPTDSRGRINQSDIMGGVQYIYENMIRAHRTVVNFSLGGLDDPNSQSFKQYEQLIDGITNKGGIVVAAAGNEGKNLDSYKRGSQIYYMVPCEFKSAICVGGTDNSQRNSKDMYGLVDFSNYGKNVDIYSPSNVKVHIMKNRKVVAEDTNGTSFSTPIVTGLVANIIGENLNYSHTRDSVLKRLLSDAQGLTLKITDGSTGYLANNGKHLIYSPDGSVNPKTTTTVRPRTTTTTTVRPRTTTTRTTTRARTTTTTRRPQPTSTQDECPGYSSGYPCCKRCSYWYTDNQGYKWGIENLRLCSVKYSCYN